MLLDVSSDADVSEPRKATRYYARSSVSTFALRINAAGDMMTPLGIASASVHTTAREMATRFIHVAAPLRVDNDIVTKAGGALHDAHHVELAPKFFVFNGVTLRPVRGTTRRRHDIDAI